MNSILRISKILFACAALVCAVLVAAPIAKADTVTFGTATPGPGFTGPVTEGGYTYSTLSGQLYVNGYGPGGNKIWRAATFAAAPPAVSFRLYQPAAVTSPLTQWTLRPTITTTPEAEPSRSKGILAG